MLDQRFGRAELLMVWALCEEGAGCISMQHGPVARAMIKAELQAVLEPFPLLWTCTAGGGASSAGSRSWGVNRCESMRYGTRS